VKKFFIRKASQCRKLLIASLVILKLSIAWGNISTAEVQLPWSPIAVEKGKLYFTRSSSHEIVAALCMYMEAIATDQAAHFQAWRARGSAATLCLLIR